MAELNSFLTGIADAIRSKKGTNDKINASNFASEIESIEAGGGAVIKTKGGWQGTPVPNSGYVENVYFNTNLSIDEVVSILDTISLNEEMGFEIILGSELDENGDSHIITISKMKNVWTIEVNAGDTLQEILFVSSDDFDFSFVGWNTNITYPLAVNFNAVNELDGIAFGSQNNLLSTLFSSTPFVQASGEVIGLSGDYDGSPIEVSESVDMKALIDEKKIPLLINVKGGSSESNNRPVMPSGYIENVYFNTALSNEEVINILKNANLTYNDYFASELVGVDTYHLIMVGEISQKDNSNTTLNQNITNGLFLLYIPQINVYIIADGNLSPIYSSQAVEGFTTFEGWKKDFSGVISMNNKAISIYFTANGGTYYIGAENDKLTQLFSITPFN